MKKINFLPGNIIISCLMAVISLSSCKINENLAYFHDLSDSAKSTMTTTVPFKSPFIQPDDILTITISALDKDLTAFLNSTNISSPTVGASSGSPTGQQAINGYLVDKNGAVELPFAGNISVAGLTTLQAKDLITTKMAKYVNNPIVRVRFSNFKITLLGEVNKPATYIVPNEKISLFDALGLAGDLTVFGKRENVLLVRDTLNNQKNMIRLNLNSKDIVSTPYFYLQPNDVIYVEPSKYKLEAIDAQRSRSLSLILVSGISLLTILISRNIIF